MCNASQCSLGAQSCHVGNRTAPGHMPPQQAMDVYLKQCSALSNKEHAAVIEAPKRPCTPSFAGHRAETPVSRCITAGCAVCMPCQAMWVSSSPQRGNHRLCEQCIARYRRAASGTPRPLPKYAQSRPDGHVCVQVVAEGTREAPTSRRDGRRGPVGPREAAHARRPVAGPP